MEQTENLGGGGGGGARAPGAPPVPTPMQGMIICTHKRYRFSKLVPITMMETLFTCNCRHVVSPYMPL